MDKWNKDDIDHMHEFVKQVGEMFKNRTILHCDSCDHEHDSVLGEKCNWCGGKMVSMIIPTEKKLLT